MPSISFWRTFEDVKNVAQGNRLKSEPEKFFRSSWSLLLYPSGNDQYKDQIGLFVMHTGRPVKIRYTLSVLHPKGKDFHSSQLIHDFENDDRGLAQLMSIDNFSDFVDHNGSVEIKCSLTTVIEDVSFDELLVFKSHVRDMFLNDKFTDFSIIVEGIVIQVHKIILSMYSPVFKAMLDHTLEESVTNRLIISDFSVRAVKCFVDAIYAVPETFDNADFDTIQETLQLADKYSVACIFDAAVEELRYSDSITVDNCLTAYCLASGLQNKRYLELVLTFIKNNGKAVLDKHEDTMMSRLGSAGVMKLFRCVVEKDAIVSS